MRRFKVRLNFAERRKGLEEIIPGESIPPGIVKTSDDRYSHPISTEKGESMNMMSLPAILGISVGAALVISFSKKNREKSAGKRLLMFIGGFAVTLAALLALNFGIYYSKMA
jgi:hypothetical protein